MNEAINKTRELARGLLSVVSEEYGLTSALRQIAMDVEDLFRFRAISRVTIGSISTI